MITRKDLKVEYLGKVGGASQNLRGVSVALLVREMGYFDLKEGMNAREYMEKMLIHRMWLRIYGHRPAIDALHEVRRMLLVGAQPPRSLEEVERVLKPIEEMLQRSFYEQ